MRRVTVLVVSVCVLGASACGSSSAKHVAARAKSGTATTLAPETTSSPDASSVSGGTSGTATVSGATSGTPTTHAGPATTTTARPTTSTTRAVPSGSTGVRGVVTAGPTCPVQHPGDPNCDDKPVPAHLELRRGDGSTAASGDAGSDGQFFITTPAGSYTLTATSPNAMRCASQPVTVSSGHVTDVHVSCDTGIR